MENEIFASGKCEIKPQGGFVKYRASHDVKYSSYDECDKYSAEFVLLEIGKIRFTFWMVVVYYKQKN